MVKAVCDKWEKKEKNYFYIIFVLYFEKTYIQLRATFPASDAGVQLTE